jgi:adenosine deaminase
MTARSAVALPKAHLHIHLEGSVRPATLKELAGRQGVSLEDFWAFRDEYEFYDRYVLVSKAIAEPNDLVRVCRELVEDEAAEGVAYTQPGIAPQVYVPRFGTRADVFELMAEGFAQGSAATGVAVGPMIEVDVSRSVGAAEEMAAFAADRRSRGVAAFGIATAFDPTPDYRPFARASEIARGAGLKFVPHAGEHDPADTVRQSLDFLRADRIAHGIRAVDDPTLLRRLANHGVACDVCPTSNVRLKAVPSIQAHPLPLMLEAGVPVTLNADDPLFFGSGVAGEYEVARASLGLTDGEIAAIARTSAEVSGADADVVARIHDGIDRWLSEAAEPL